MVAEFSVVVVKLVLEDLYKEVLREFVFVMRIYCFLLQLLFLILLLQIYFFSVYV